MSSDEKQIRDLIATWMTATQHGDVDKVLSLMTDDVVFLVTGMPPFGKQKFAETMQPAEPAAPRPHIEGHSDIQELTVLGDWAYVWTRLTIEVTPPGGGQALKRAGNTLSVLRKRAGRWLLARDANMLAPVN